MIDTYPLLGLISPSIILLRVVLPAPLGPANITRATVRQEESTTLLKRLGWIAYGLPLVLYIAVYPSNIGGFKLESLDGETVVAINYDPRKAIRIVRNMVMPGEHMDEYNDGTYFRYK